MRALLGIILALIGAASTHANTPRFTVVQVDTAQEHLQVFLRDENGNPFRSIEKLNGWLKSRNQHLLFAMNAGMFEPDFSPVGLLVSQGKELAPLNLREGRGNFYMKPNGVFLLTQSGPEIIESPLYPTKRTETLLATQSGPLLLIHGAIHPKFDPRSKSRHIRNGVGVRGTTAFFVISDEPVNFYELAVYFRDELKCQDALYFDGVVSALLSSEHGRKGSHTQLGPIIGVVR